MKQFIINCLVSLYRYVIDVLTAFSTPIFAILMVLSWFFIITGGIFLLISKGDDGPGAYGFAAVLYGGIGVAAVVLCISILRFLRR